MLMLVIGATLIAILFYYIIIKPYDYWKDRGVRQGKPMWILGDGWRTVLRLESTAEMLEYMYNLFPNTRYSGFYRVFSPTLILRDPDLLKQLTVKDFDHFTDHSHFMPESDPIWSKNLFARKGQEWREMRTIISPTFTSSKMRAMFVLMAECAENLVQQLLTKNKDTSTVEMRDTFTRFTTDVIATTVFGVKVNSLGEPNNEFYLMGKQVTDLKGLWKTLKFLLYFLFPKVCEILTIRLFDQKAKNFFIELVDETIKTREEQGIVRPDMIHLLMEARKGIETREETGVIDTGFATAQESNLVKEKISKEITNLDIAAQALGFFLAGSDSVANPMCFMSYELAVNSDIQENLRKEVLDVLEKSEGKLTYECLLQMKYMDMVVSEVLRKWPNVVAVDRVCTKPYTIEPVLPGEKPLHLNTGLAVWLPIYSMHRDPKYFPDPERFDPERFNDENKKKIKPYTYFPFGLGPRNCIGSRFALIETKLIFFHILLHFNLVPVEKTSIPVKLSKESFTLTADGGFWIGLKRIKA